VFAILGKIPHFLGYKRTSAWNTSQFRGASNANYANFTSGVVPNFNTITCQAGRKLSLNCLSIEIFSSERGRADFCLSISVLVLTELLSETALLENFGGQHRFLLMADQTSNVPLVLFSDTESEEELEGFTARDARLNVEIAVKAPTFCSKPAPRQNGLASKEKTVGRPHQTMIQAYLPLNCCQRQERLQELLRLIQWKENWLLRFFKSQIEARA